MCFCHEALGRALHDTFPGISIDKIDRAHEKYLGAAAYPAIERSAWYEFLRNGPNHAFRLPSGIDGGLSRYRIWFNVPDHTDESEKIKVQQFLEGLKSRNITIEQDA